MRSDLVNPSLLFDTLASYDMKNGAGLSFFFIPHSLERKFSEETIPMNLKKEKINLRPTNVGENFKKRKLNLLPPQNFVLLKQSLIFIYKRQKKKRLYTFCFIFKLGAYNNFILLYFCLVPLVSVIGSSLTPPPTTSFPQPQDHQGIPHGRVET